MLRGKFLRSLGPHVLEDGQICWRVWAPLAERVELILFPEPGKTACLTMTPEDLGYYSLVLPHIEDGLRYAYRLNGAELYPDPASLWQPQGVHQPSAVVRTDQFSWSDHRWKGIQLQDLIIYELHVGTFTEAGTFTAIVDRLPDLIDLGITAIELMPVAQFPGERNWGYDGVHLYAVQNSYGGPHALAGLVDACHRHGVAVILDVVYNHLGPEGNYLDHFGPYFSDRYRTPWGPALNYDGAGSDEVRRYICDNVRLWLEEYHIDGLRLDAIHAIYDMLPRHILHDIRQAADEIAAWRGWPALLIAESNLNDVRFVKPREQCGYELDALWNDDYHHALHAYYTGERNSYYIDFGEAQQIAKAWEHTYALDGVYSKYRQRRQGAPARGVSGEHFVVYLQNHDLVANRIGYHRLVTRLEPATYRQAVCLVLAAPYIPLLFMGEEYGEDRPFYFFTSFLDADLARKVQEGRRAELLRMGWAGPIADPQAVETFLACKLSWDWPAGSLRAALRRMYRDLLSYRKSWPAWRDFVNRRAILHTPQEPKLLELWRGDVEGGTGTRLLCNLTAEPQPLPACRPSEALLFSSEWARYGGVRKPESAGDVLYPWECVVYGPSAWLAHGE